MQGVSVYEPRTAPAGHGGRRMTPEGQEADSEEFYDPFVFDPNTDTFTFNTTGVIHTNMMDPTDVGEIMLADGKKVNAKEYLDQVYNYSVHTYVFYKQH